MEQPQRLATPGTGDKERRRFKCGRCDKRFRRSEHCGRHELMHTEERPFKCSYCSKRYGRKDLLRRHERTIHAEQYKNDTAQAAAQKSPPARGTEESSEVQDEEQSHRISSSAADDDMPETPQTMDDARDVGNGYIGEPTAPPIANVDPFAQLELSNIDTGMQPLHFLGTDSFSLLKVSNLSEPSFLYPLMSNTVLPPAASPRQPGAETFAGSHAKEKESHGVAQSARNRTRQSSMPPSTPSDRLPGDARIDVGFDSTLWGAPSTSAHGEYNLDPFNLDFDITQSPLDVWSQNPDNITLHLPVIMREPPGQSPRNILDVESFECLHNDISLRLGVSTPPKPLFSFQELQQFTNSYIDSFHPHLPFIHLATLSLVDSPCQLVLAMASIGALYRLQRRRAYELYEAKWESREPVWLLQTRLLLAMFGTFSSKPDLASETFKKMGCLMLEYQWRRIELQNRVADRNKLIWSEWVEIEQTKRTLCAMFIFSSMLLIAFNITPGFVVDRDLVIDVPDNESLWAASSAQEWEKLRDSLSPPSTVNQTLHKAVELMIQPPADEAEPEDHGSSRPVNTVPLSYSLPMSGFTALVVMHGVNIYLWHLNQLAQTVSRVSLRIWPQENLHTALLHAASMTLERCQATLVAEQSDDGKLGLYDPSHIYIFNCGAVLRIASSRLLPVSHSFNRLALLTKDQKVVAHAVKAYARKPLQRTMFVTKAAKMALNGFLGPVKIGALLVSKTAALSWSVEQAIAGWDSALLLTKWVHGLEMAGADNPPDSEEAQIVNDLKSLLVEVDVSGDHDHTWSLAAILAKVWASFLDDTWVWGVTPNMSSILRLLGKEYQERFTAAVPLNS